MKETVLLYRDNGNPIAYPNKYRRLLELKYAINTIELTYYCGNRKTDYPVVTSEIEGITKFVINQKINWNNKYVFTPENLNALCYTIFGEPTNIFVGYETDENGEKHYGVYVDTVDTYTLEVKLLHYVYINNLNAEVTHNLVDKEKVTKLDITKHKSTNKNLFCNIFNKYTTISDTGSNFYCSFITNYKYVQLESSRTVKYIDKNNNEITPDEDGYIDTTGHVQPITASFWTFSSERPNVSGKDDYTIFAKNNKDDNYTRINKEIKYTFKYISNKSNLNTSDALDLFYIDKNTGDLMYVDNYQNKIKKVLTIDSNIILNGTSQERPKNVSIGLQYFDITINKPIWYKGDNTWVDAMGITV